MRGMRHRSDCYWRIEMATIRRASAGMLSLAAIAFATPAIAGWKLMPSQHSVNLGGIAVTPSSDWNQASARPGKQSVAWTHDGFDLNALEFFAAVPSGQPLYRERDRKRNPMPKF